MSFEKEIPFDLTDEEVRECSELMARSVQNIETMKDERKIEVKRRNVEIIALQSRVDDLADKVINRTELRPVECFWQKCYEDATMQLIREDTQGIIDTRPLTEDETQMSLDLEVGEDKAA